jgi:hypothetical protein
MKINIKFLISAFLTIFSYLMFTTAQADCYPSFGHCKQGYIKCPGTWCCTPPCVDKSISK